MNPVELVNWVNATLHLSKCIDLTYIDLFTPWRVTKEMYNPRSNKVGLGTGT